MKFFLSQSFGNTALVSTVVLMLFGSVVLQISIGIPQESDVAVDVYFLADNTGSMSREIRIVREQAKFIFNQLAAQASQNIRFGVGAYKDFGDNFVFNNILGLTQEDLNVPATEDPIVLAMGEWQATGGGDLPEAQLYALYLIATSEYENIGWRNNAVRIIVWFGDAPGHDPASRTIDRIPITEQLVIDALKEKDIRVSAFDMENMDQTGQANRIAMATQGDLTFLTREQGESPTPTPAPTPTPTPIPQNQSSQGQNLVSTLSYVMSQGLAVAPQVEVKGAPKSDLGVGVGVGVGAPKSEVGVGVGVPPKDPVIKNPSISSTIDPINKNTPEDPFIVNTAFESTLIPDDDNDDQDLPSAIIQSVQAVVEEAVNS